MPEYKKVQVPTGVGYEYTKYPDGTEYWYLNGKLHRPDGPAYIFPDKRLLWYLEGTRLEPNQIEKMKHLLTCDLNELPLYINTEFRSVVEYRLNNF